MHLLRHCTLPLILGLALLSTQPAAAQKEPSTAQLGQKIADVSFPTADGKKLAWHQLKGTKATVVVFLSFECPVSNHYCQMLEELHKEQAKYGISYVGIVANDDLSAREVARQAKEFGLSFPVLVDQDYRGATALQANITPEAFVLDDSFTLRYRGRIDDTWYARLKRNQQTSHHDLRQVLGEIMSGRQVLTPATAAVGCAIPREQKKTPQTGPVTYYRDVLPILQERCQSCHRPGEVGPFSLLTYRQAVNWGDDIKTYTQSRQMPPWKPSEGVPLHNDRRLSDREITTLAKWVDGGMPQGDAKDAPPTKTFPDGWHLGTPDLILTVPSAMQLGPNGRDLFRVFVLPSHLTEDKYVEAIELRPGNPRIVHHALLFADPNGEGRKLEQSFQQKKPAPPDPHATVNLDKGPGYTVSMGIGFFPRHPMGGWAPGNLAHRLPEGYGYFLPKGSDVIVQVHYHRNGKLEKDQTRVGLYFSKNPKTKPYQGGVLAGHGPNLPRPWFAIPAGAENYRIAGTHQVTDDLTLHTAVPHMHVLGKKMRLVMTDPSGKKTTLIGIGDWDYNWQETYFFKTPVQVQKGSLLEVEAFYDNSAKNPYNPSSPPKMVTFGEETTNEMCFLFLGGVSERPRSILGGRQVLPIIPSSGKAPPKEASSQ